MAHICSLFAYTFILLSFSTNFIFAQKFEVFGCGLSDKLGIGVTESKSIPMVTKLILPEDVKTTTIFRLTSSSNTHCIQTSDSNFLWGLNENQRISKFFFTQQPKIVVPGRVFRNVSLQTGFESGDSGANTVILNFDEFTFEVRRGIDFLDVKICGVANGCWPFLPVTEFSFQFGKSRSIRPFPRSYHKTMNYHNGDVIDTKKISDLFPSSIPICDEEFACTSLKIANYMNFQIHLQKSMKLFVSKVKTKEDDRRILGLPLLTEFYTTLDSKAEVYKEILLDFDTNQGRFKYFRNIFNGPYSTIVLTQDKKLLGWGKNNYNLLGFSGIQMNEDIVFPPKIIDTLPDIEDIKQISIGFDHTLVLLKNSTVLGIGSNLQGQLGRFEGSKSTKWVQIQFGVEEQNCIVEKTCSIELIAAEQDVSFFVFNYGIEQHVKMVPICFSKSHLDLDACSMNGLCVDNDVCECFDGYYGANCNITFDCSHLNNCSGNGFCTEYRNCSCSIDATGLDCSIPICGDYRSVEENVCSGHGKCKFLGGNSLGTKCYCENGYNGTFCGDGPNKLLLYMTYDPTTYWGLKPFKEKIHFLLTQTTDNTVIKNFAFNSFFVGDYFHSLGVNGITIGAKDNSVYLAPYTRKTLRLQNITDISPFLQSTYVKNIEGFWRSIGFAFDVEETFSDFSTDSQRAREVINMGQIILFLAMDGYLSGIFRNKGLAKMTQVKIIDDAGKSVLLSKLCLESNIALNTKGEVFTVNYNVLQAGELFISLSNAEIFQTYFPIYEIFCRTNVIFRNKNGLFTMGENKYNHLGHNFRQKIGEVDFKIEGKNILDFDIGDTHSVVLTEDVITNKKSLYVIGDNTYGQFGYQGAPSHSDHLIEAQLDPEVLIQNVTRVSIHEKRTFIGIFENSHPLKKEKNNRVMNECYGIPDYLTGLVCSFGKGTCKSGKCACDAEHYNLEELDSYQQTMIKIINFVLPLGLRPFGILYALGIKSFNAYELGENNGNECNIGRIRVGELETIKYFGFGICFCLFLIIVFFVILVCGCFIAILTVIFVLCIGAGGAGFLGILSAIATLVVPAFCCCLKFSLKRQRKKDKDELLKGLLESTGAQGGESLEMDNNMKNGLEKIDLSFFNVDFNDYKIEKDIVSGGSGALCFQAKDKKTHENVFMKMFVLKKNNDGEYDMKEFQNEIKLFTRLRHTNIVGFYGFFCAPPSRVGYVCEFCNKGTLSSFLEQLERSNLNNPNKEISLNTAATSSRKYMLEKAFTTEKKINYLLQIAKGMRYLHQKGIIFRDLKPQNILIGENDILKITDFGISRTINASDSSQMTAKAGTSTYVAPEVTQGKNYNEKADVFSFGIMIYEILFETMQPYGPNPGLGIDFLISTQPDYRPQIPKNGIESYNMHQKTYDSLISLMKKCWDHDPEIRPSFAEIVQILFETENQFFGNENDI